MRGTSFVWASDFIEKNKDYLPRVIDIATCNSLSRIKKCCHIMGRKEGDQLSSSQIIYPCMQCAGIFELGDEHRYSNGIVTHHVDVCQLGLDQRKVNVLGRECAAKLGVKAPIILFHHMLMGLKALAVKMSKLDPNGAIFMEDSAEDVTKKIRSAFCNNDTEGNPIFEYIKYIILRWFPSVTLCGKDYTNINEVENDFAEMNKAELKADVAKYINFILEPVRKHFENGYLKQLAENVAKYRVTR